MTIDEVLRTIKDNIYLGIAGVIVLFVLIGVGYIVIYRKLLKGKKKINTKQTIILFLIAGYIIMVVGVTFLNRRAGIYGGFNFNLLSSYKEAWNNFEVRTWQYLIFNIIMFVPLGFLLPVAHIKFQKIGFTFLAGLMLTLLIELLQFVTASGIFDIDDIINNLLGTLMGYSIVMTFINLHKRQKHKYRKAFVYFFPFLIVTALFAGVFTYYNLKELGNLSVNYNHKLNMKNTIITNDLTFSSEEKVVPIYKAPSLSKELSKEFAVDFFENINVNTSNLEIIDYHEEVVYWSRGGKDDNSYNIWLNNIDGSFSFTDYSFFNDDVAPKEATEEVIKENLEYFDINIPEVAKFESETMGDFIFSVDKKVVDNKLIHGVLSCSYYNDNTIKNIDNNLVVYEKVKDIVVISEMEAYERIKEGKFTENLPKELGIYKVKVDIDEDEYKWLIINDIELTDKIGTVLYEGKTYETNELDESVKVKDNVCGLIVKWISRDEYDGGIQIRFAGEIESEGYYFIYHDEMYGENRGNIFFEEEYFDNIPFYGEKGFNNFSFFKTNELFDELQNFSSFGKGKFKTSNYLLIYNIGMGRPVSDKLTEIISLDEAYKNMFIFDKNIYVGLSDKAKGFIIVSSANYDENQNHISADYYYINKNNPDKVFLFSSGSNNYVLKVAANENEFIMSTDGYNYTTGENDGGHVIIFKITESGVESKRLEGLKV